MDRPSLPPVVPGCSALPAFLAVEAELRSRLAASRMQAERTVEDATVEGERIRREGEERLKRVVIEAQETALREAEGRQRDRVSRTRARIQRWVQEAEEAARQTLDEALDLCCGE